MKGIVVTAKDAVEIREFAAPLHKTLGEAVGGWIEIEAPDIHAAAALFRAYHPDKTEGILNCSSVYAEEQFERSKMSGPDGNFGRRCHERITVTRVIND